MQTHPTQSKAGAWRLQDAKAQFSELVENAMRGVPQHVTRRGKQAVVVLSEKDFDALQRNAATRKPKGLIEHLLAIPKAPVQLASKKRAAADAEFPDLDLQPREIDFLMILLDTVVLSELRKTKPNAAVVAYLQAQTEGATFISALSIGEIEAGIERQRSQNPGFATELEQWLVTLELQFSHCILPVTPAIAKLWGRLCVQTGNRGVDNLIAATALCHNLTVVTRNVKHFEPTGARVVNPFVDV